MIDKQSNRNPEKNCSEPDRSPGQLPLHPKIHPHRYPRGVDWIHRNWFPFHRLIHPHQYHSDRGGWRRYTPLNYLIHLHPDRGLNHPIINWVRKSIPRNLACHPRPHLHSLDFRKVPWCIPKNQDGKKKTDLNWARFRSTDRRLRNRNIQWWIPSCLISQLHFHRSDMSDHSIRDKMLSGSDPNRRTLLHHPNIRLHRYQPNLDSNWQFVPDYRARNPHPHRPGLDSIETAIPGNWLIRPRPDLLLHSPGQNQVHRFPPIHWASRPRPNPWRKDSPFPIQWLRENHFEKLNSGYGKKSGRWTVRY